MQFEHSLLGDLFETKMANACDFVPVVQLQRGLQNHAPLASVSPTYAPLQTLPNIGLS